MRSLALLFLFLPLAGAQDPIPIPDEEDLRIIGDTVRPVLDPVVATAVETGETILGEDLTQEDIRVGVHLNATNADFQMFGILFGGGKVQADFTVDGYLEFRAVNVERLDQALAAATGDQNITLNGTFGVPTSRVALTAEEVRLLGAGFLLEAFQAYEVAKAQELLMGMLPGLRVLALEVAWSGVTPLTWAPGPGSSVEPGAPVIPLREPPIRLDVLGEFQYLTRIGLYDTLRGIETGDAPTEPDPTKVRLEETQMLPMLERPAFQVLGYGQLLNFSLPGPWRLEVLVTVPKGFTVEHVTDEMVAAGNAQSASFALDGRAAGEGGLAAIATASSRGLITWTLFAVAAFVGIVLRAFVEVGATGVNRLGQKRTKRDVQAKK